MAKEMINLELITLSAPTLLQNASTQMVVCTDTYRYIFHLYVSNKLAVLGALALII